MKCHFDDRQTTSAATAIPTTGPLSLYIERLVSVLSAAPERVLIRRGDEQTHGRELLEGIYRYARVLEAQGIGRGDVVALLAVNCMDALAIRYAANLLGAGASFLSAPAAMEARSALIDAIAPRLLVVFPETAALVPTDLKLPLCGVGMAPPGGFDLRLACAEMSRAPLPCRASAQDLAVIVSSGGSTGVPKGSWRTFQSYSHMVNVPSPADRRQLINGPLAYLSQVLVDVTLLGGGTVVLRDRYEARDTAATIQSEQITDLFLVEPQLFDLVEHPTLLEFDLSSLRTLTHIGASAPASLRMRAHERFGARIVHVYGSSEEGLVSTLPANAGGAGSADFQSAGYVLPGVEVRLRRKDETLALAGETGSVEVRSPAMAQGYRNRPDLQAQAFRDGWYRSGDLGCLSNDGRLQIFGRATDIAFVGGRMVSPTLIEDTLCRLRAVRYACVVADPKTGGWIALTLPSHGAHIDAATCLHAIAAAHGYSVARSLTLLVRDAVPLTPQGKPDREAIRALAPSADAALPVESAP